MKYGIIGGLSLLLLSGCGSHPGFSIDAVEILSQIEVDTETPMEVIRLGSKRKVYLDFQEKKRDGPIYLKEMRIPKYHLSIKFASDDDEHISASGQWVRSSIINPRQGKKHVCYPYPITLYHYTGTIEEGVQALSQKFGVDFQQIVDFEKRFYDPRPRLRSEIFDGMSIWGQSIIDGVKDGTIVFYERNEDINDRLDNLWLWQRFLLFNKNYPNMVYHISGGGADCRHPEMTVFNFIEN